MPRGSGVQAKQAKDPAGVAERLKQARERAGLTQQALAEATGGRVGKAYISRIEQAARNASYETLRSLAGPLGVSPDWLERGEEGPALGVSFDAVLRNRALDALNEAEAAIAAARKALVASVAEAA